MKSNISRLDRWNTWPMKKPNNGPVSGIYFCESADSRYPVFKRSKSGQQCLNFELTSRDPALVHSNPILQSTLKKNGKAGSGEGDRLGPPKMGSEFVLEKLRLANLFRHYYPEGHWGYMILVAATLCHFFMSGFQLGFGTASLHIGKRFLDRTQDSMGGNAIVLGKWKMKRQGFERKAETLGSVKSVRT